MRNHIDERAAMRRNRTLGSKPPASRRFGLIVLIALITLGSAVVLAATFGVPS